MWLGSAIIATIFCGIEFDLYGSPIYPLNFYSHLAWSKFIFFFLLSQFSSTAIMVSILNIRIWLIAYWSYGPVPGRNVEFTVETKSAPSFWEISFQVRRMYHEKTNKYVHK